MNFGRFQQTGLVLGATLLLLALVLGGLQARFPVLLWNSTWVVLGSLAVSLLFGAPVGWMLGWTQTAGRRFWLAMLLAWAATPLIVQISAWDALWGRLSWISALGHVNYTRWFDGVLAVIWIHGFANLPWVALLMDQSRQWVPGDVELYSQTTQGPWKTMLGVSFPRLGGVFLIAGLLVAIRTFEQFEVTDVYQVRTWAEIWYMGFSLGEFDDWSAGILPSGDQLFRILGSPFPNTSKIPSVQEVPEQVVANTGFGLVPVLVTPLLMLSAVVLMLWSAFGARLGVRESAQQYSQQRLPASGASLWLPCVGILLPLAIQLGNLLIRLGVKATTIDGRPQMGWAWENAWEMLGYAWGDYWPAIAWSYLIGGTAAILVVTVSLVLAWFCRNRPWWQGGIALAGLLLFAIPSPLLSLLIYRTVNLSSWQPLSYAASTSILAPVIVLVIKYFGVGILLWQMVLGRESWEREALMQLRSGRALTDFFQLGVRRYGTTGVGFSVFLTIVLSGDLATTFATVPPGMDTFPRRILGDLHAGAGSQVAAACLWQWLIVGMSCWVLAGWMNRQRSV